MKKIVNIAYALAVTAVMTGCADYVDTSDFKVDKPESISTYEYLKDYGTLNTYVDRSAHPNFKLGATVNTSDFLNRSSIYALACSNFDMVTPQSELMHASCVGADGIISTTAVRQLAEYSAEAGIDVYGHAVLSNAQQANSWLKSVESNAVASLGNDQKIIDSEVNFTETNTFPFTLINNFKPTVTDGVLVANITGKKHQFYLAENFPTTIGETYEIIIKVRGNKDTNLTLQFPNKDNTTKFPVLTEWQVVTVEMKAVADVSSIIVDPGNIKVNLEVEYAIVRHQRGLTDEEKRGLYVNELDRWISAIMEAGAGKITNWELIDKPLADAGDNGEGYYPLMAADNGPASNFYWVDYLGEIDFAKVAESKARSYFAEFGGNAGDLKLYVNENCVDDVQKAESLLYWIKKWEAAGVKIDGIGTELHLECPATDSDLKYVRSLVDLNLSTLKKSGKLVRISALDVTFKDENGTSVATADLTLDQKKAVGEFYKEIIKSYFTLIPAEQQGGINVWTVIDGGSVSGLWNGGYERTPAYGGFADGLQNK